MPTQVNSAAGRFGQGVNRIREWVTRRPQIALAAAGTVLVIISWMVFLPPFLEIRQVSRQCRNLKEATAQAHRLLDQVRAGQFPALPRVSAMPDVLNGLNELARSHQIQFLEVKPGLPHPGTVPGSTLIQIDLRIEGQYRAVGEFLGALAKTTSLGVPLVRRINIDRNEQLLPRVQATLSMELVLSEVFSATPS